jgi:hypothetical protein
VEGEDTGTPSPSIHETNVRITFASMLILGGALMMIGSDEPWTYSGVHASGLIIYRNGLQLGVHDRFSPAGLFPLAMGLVAMLIGSTRIAEKSFPRVIDAHPIVPGLFGVGFALYAAGEANWYTHQMTDAYPKLFTAGAGVGVWLLLAGGLIVFVAAVLSGHALGSRRNRLLAAVVASAAVLASSALLAPG